MRTRASIFLWLSYIVGGDPVLTVCAVAGGSCFGDNIGMISDVTVLSCGMQDVKIIDRGFYPQGGGRVLATLDPIKEIKPLDIKTLGDLVGIKAVCFSQRLPDWVTKDMMRSCGDALAPIADVEFEIHKTEGDSRGAGIVLVAEFENGMLGSNALTSRGHTADKAGEDAAADLIKKAAAIDKIFED